MKKIPNFRLLLICIGMIGCSSLSQLHADEQKRVIFDLGGVLFYSSEATVAWQLGPIRTVLPYLIKHKSTSGITEQFYKILNKVDGSQGNKYEAKDDTGNILPNIIAEWLIGAREPTTTLENIRLKIDQNPQWFKTTQEKNLVIAISKSVFKPERFVKQWKPVPGMKEFVQECKNKGYKLAVLSNWDEESFELLKQEHSDLFSLFDDIVISAIAKTLKPDRKMFDTARNNLDPKSCIFIDDQEENTKKAKVLGLQHVLVAKQSGCCGKYVDVKGIKEDFYRLEQLSKKQK